MPLWRFVLIGLFTVVSPLVLAKPLQERLQPIPRTAYFQMEGYFVWDGSMIKVGDTYHLFASRWPVSTGFPEGYRRHSELIRATAPSASGPFTFAGVVLPKRTAGEWDSGMRHNPRLIKAGDEYVLFYIGSPTGQLLRHVGYAVAKSVEGPWTLLDRPLDLEGDANNPSPFQMPDGTFRLSYRNRELVNFIAEAPTYRGPYRVVARDIFSGVKMEDADVSFWSGRYHMIIEDNVGKMTGHERFGAHFLSRDGLQWERAEPVVAYDHTLKWADGQQAHATRRERPQLFFDTQDGKRAEQPTHLLTAILLDGSTGCVVQPIGPE